jgi:hypothetical protein
MARGAPSLGLLAASTLPHQPRWRRCGSLDLGEVVDAVGYGKYPGARRRTNKHRRSLRCHPATPASGRRRRVNESSCAWVSLRHRRAPHCRASGHQQQQLRAGVGERLSRTREENRHQATRVPVRRDTSRRSVFSTNRWHFG